MEQENESGLADTIFREFLKLIKLEHNRNFVNFSRLCQMALDLERNTHFRGMHRSNLLSIGLECHG